MPKVAKALGALEVKRLNEPGLHAVGTVPGLRLSISASGAKSWILRIQIGSKRRDVGLGGYPGVTLAAAVERAREVMTGIRAGIDPVAERKAAREIIAWTFKRCAQEYIETHRPGWKNAKHAQQWENTLATYAFPVFGAKHVKDVNPPDVVDVLRPLWSTKPETARRVRSRIELVLSWAAAQGHRPRELNPAQWRGHLDQILPKPGKVVDRRHHEAMPLDGVYAFMETLRPMLGMGARCLHFLVLTACRSGEARGALWSEIDMQNAVWTIPGSRMKAGKPHRVPLSTQALRLLRGIPQFVTEDGEPVDLIFQGRDTGQVLSDMTLTVGMRRMGQVAVPHGFRSTFADWCAERTHFSAELRELSLAHSIGNQTEAAYRRGDQLEKRREVMQAWADFVITAPAAKGGNVVPLRATA
jgi:integrase